MYDSCVDLLPHAKIVHELPTFVDKSNDETLQLYVSNCVLLQQYACCVLIIEYNLNRVSVCTSIQKMYVDFHFFEATFEDCHNQQMFDYILIQDLFHMGNIQQVLPIF